MCKTGGYAVMSSTKPLLHKFPSLATGSADELSAALSPYFGKAIVEPERRSSNFHVQLNICRLKRIALTYSTSSDAFGIDVDENSRFLHGFPVQGIAEHLNNGMLVSDSPERGAVGQPGSLKLSYGPNFEIFAVFLDPAALSDVLSGLVGGPLTRKLKLDRTDDRRQPEAPMIRNLVRVLIAELDRETSDLSPLVIAEIEQAIMVAYLSGVPHNYSDQLNGRDWSISRRQVSRAEAYIEANWKQPISVEALAAVTNVSARSIFNSFQQYRGYSPMKFVKQIRLRHANAMLMRPDSDTSVTKVSFECGFGNLSHFAMDYKRLFGESPSLTLQRAKSL
jgi:AraC-like DNA-binding protein